MLQTEHLIDNQLFTGTDPRSKDWDIQQGPGYPIGPGYPARTGISSKDQTIQQGPGYPARTGLASKRKEGGLASKDRAS